MATLFVVCATLGGTLLVLQFLLTLVGIGGHSLGLDVPQDAGHDLGSFDHGLGGDAGGDAGSDATADSGADTAADTDAHAHAGGSSHAGTAHPAGPTIHDVSGWLFRAISYRTLVAAMAFFGLTGLAAQAAEATDTTALGLGLAAGVGAMYVVYAMLQGMSSLRAEGTARIHRSIGRLATVYLRIPPQNSGSGKIQINLQNRTMEYSARTAGEAIPAGATVVVTEVLGPDSVQVQPAPQPERNSHA